MTSNIIKVIHTGISVENMDESIVWYEKNLGFHVIKDEYASPLGARVVFIRRDDLDYEIELFQYNDPKALPDERRMPNSDLQTIGTKHVAFLTDDMHLLKKGLLENGVDIAHEVHMGTSAVMFIRDCNGVLIEFIQETDSGK